VATIYRCAVHLQTLVRVTKFLTELTDRESDNTTTGTCASCLSTKTAICLNSATPIFPHSKQFCSLHTVQHWTVCSTTQRQCFCMNQEVLSKGACLVDGLQVVKQSNFASIPSEDSPLARSIQIGYWAHTAYYSMGTGNKAAGVW